MTLEYSQIEAVDDETFNETAKTFDFSDIDKFTKSDDKDIKKIEWLLDVREGILAGDDYFLQKIVCVCGRNLTFYDFVFTALADAGHSKSLILHTLVGTKKIINPSRMIRCSNCGRTAAVHGMYGMPASYLCTGPNNPAEMK